MDCNAFAFNSDENEGGSPIAKGSPWESDYDHNCTPLFKRIEEGEWDAVIIFIDTGFWPFHLIKDSKTAAEQARTWVTRRNPDAPTQIKWSQLPLHLALVLGAPVGVVRRLVEIYPASVTRTDDEDMLPLHLALRHANEDTVVDVLLKAFPEAIHSRGKNNRVTLEFVMHGRTASRIKILTMYVKQNKAFDDTGCNEKFLIRFENELSLSKELLHNVNVLLSALQRERVNAQYEVKSKSDELARTKQYFQRKTEELRDAKKSLLVASSVMLDQNTSTGASDGKKLLEEQRVELYESYNTDLEIMMKNVENDEAIAQAYLETIDICIAHTLNLGGLQDLIKQVDGLKSDRFQFLYDRIMADIDMLKHNLKFKVEHDENEVKKDLELIDKILEKVVAISNNRDTLDDLMKLQVELVPWKEGLKRKLENNLIKHDLKLIRRMLAQELIKVDGDEAENVDNLSTMISTLKQSNIDRVTLEELCVIQERALAVRKVVQSNAFINTTELDMLKTNAFVKELLKSSGESNAKVLQQISTTLEKSFIPCIRNKSIDFVLGIRMELKAMREEIKRIVVVCKLQRDLHLLRDALKAHMAKEVGREKERLSLVLKNIDSLLDSLVESSSFDDVVAINKTLQGLSIPEAVTAAVPDHFDTNERSLVI